MPAPNEWAEKLADTLKELGDRLGANAEKEYETVNGNNPPAIDVAWTWAPEDNPWLNSTVVVATFEIQYSRSIASIGWGAMKARSVGSAKHFIISYYPVSQSSRTTLEQAGHSSPWVSIFDDRNEIAHMLLKTQSQLIKEDVNLAEVGRSAVERVVEAVETGADSNTITETVDEVIEDLMLKPLISISSDQQLIDTNPDIIANCFTALFDIAFQLMRQAGVSSLSLGSEEFFREAMSDNLSAYFHKEEIRSGLQLQINGEDEEITVIGIDGRIQVWFEGRDICFGWSPRTDICSSLTYYQAKNMLETLIRDVSHGLRDYRITPDQYRELQNIITRLRSI